ncbi:MAG: RND transporter [Planctomycetes bacterium]|jgi:hypothetical protein|nr:RND transporter [Planctomycetota bacterium]
MFARLSGFAVLTLVAVLGLSTIGCTSKDQPDPKKKGGDAQAKTNPDDNKKEIKKDDHSDWWCKEHGVPEHLCSLCQGDVFEKYKKEGKLCKVHPDRAEEQCFKCDPSRYEKYEAMYMAKYNGKKPERPPETEFKK